MLFISHDLAIVEHMTPPRRRDVPRQDRRSGADKAALFAAPQHPYTEALLSAVPVPDPGIGARIASSCKGDVPSPINPPPRLPFPHPLPLRLRPL
jgi:peptide/nickel transport system ATP-binding protein